MLVTANERGFPSWEQGYYVLNSEGSKTSLVPRSAWNARSSDALRPVHAAERRAIGIPRRAWNKNVTALPSWERHEWILYSYITLHIAYRYYENIMYLFA